MLTVTALAVVRTRSLFAVVTLSGVFSLLSALLFVTMDAVDVAFTEAAGGWNFNCLNAWHTGFDSTV